MKVGEAIFNEAARIPMLGITGIAQSGKDTVADFLVREYGFTKLAFAEPLRRSLFAVNPWVFMWYTDAYNLLGADYETGLAEVDASYHVTGIGYIIRTKALVNLVGYEKAKQVAEFRRLLQNWGLEGGREIHGDDVWIRAAMRQVQLDHRGIVFADVRFDNEAQAVLDQGGMVIRVVRPGVTPPNSHASENGVADQLINMTIVNDTASIGALNLRLGTWSISDWDDHYQKIFG